MTIWASLICGLLGLKCKYFPGRDEPGEGDDGTWEKGSRCGGEHQDDFALSFRIKLAKLWAVSCELHPVKISIILRYQDEINYFIEIFLRNILEAQRQRKWQDKCYLYAIIYSQQMVGRCWLAPSPWQNIPRYQEEINWEIYLEAQRQSKWYGKRYLYVIIYQQPSPPGDVQSSVPPYQSGALSLVGRVEILLSLLVETLRELKYFHDVATPALLCHKEPARHIQGPLLGALDRKIPLLLAGSLWHKGKMASMHGKVLL